MPFRHVLGGLAAAVLLLGLVACGGDELPPNSDSRAEATSTPASQPAVRAAGIGVTDLKASSAFYRSVFGMTELTTYEIPGYMDEIVLGFEGTADGPSVVLMHYTDGKQRSYTDNPVKIVFSVPDPTETAAKIKAAGGSVVLEPAPQAAFGDVVVGLAKDPDGYTLELLELGSGSAG